MKDGYVILVTPTRGEPYLNWGVSCGVFYETERGAEIAADRLRRSSWYSKVEVIPVRIIRRPDETEGTTTTH